LQLALPDNLILSKLTHLNLASNAFEKLDDIHQFFLGQVQHLDLSRYILA
jgi:hypothetical protein